MLEPSEVFDITDHQMLFTRLEKMLDEIRTGLVLSIVQRLITVKSNFKKKHNKTSNTFGFWRSSGLSA